MIRDGTGRAAGRPQRTDGVWPLCLNTGRRPRGSRARPLTPSRTNAAMSLSSRSSPAGASRSRPSPAVRSAGRTLVSRPPPLARSDTRAMVSKKDTKQIKEEEAKEQKKPGIDFAGVKQLIMMGMGTVAGDITEINLNDPQRTVVMELEANNFEDADGKPISYIQDQGYVAEDGESSSPLNLVLPVVIGGAALLGVFATLKALS